MELHTQSMMIEFFKKIVSPISQILFIILLAIMAIAIAYSPYKRFAGKEKQIALMPITPDQIIAWGGIPTRVSVGMYISNFPELDFVNNSFTFDGIIWFEFDPALISLSTVGKFFFEKGEIIQQSEPYTQVIENKFFARYNIRVRFKTDLDYKYFPFDGHRIDIVLINRTIQPGEMIFRSYHSFFKLAPDIIPAGWLLYGTGVRTGWVQSVLDKYESHKIVSHPRAIFSIFIRRGGIRSILLILLPLFMIHFISLFCFAFDPRTQAVHIFGLASGGVTALLGYRFVIENMTPKVGYFVLSDQVFTLFLAASLIEFLFAVILIRTGKLTSTLIILRGITYLAINIIFLASWYYLLH